VHAAILLAFHFGRLAQLAARLQKAAARSLVRALQVFFQPCVHVIVLVRQVCRLLLSVRILVQYLLARGKALCQILEQPAFLAVVPTLSELLLSLATPALIAHLHHHLLLMPVLRLHAKFFFFLRKSQRILSRIPHLCSPSTRRNIGVSQVVISSLKINVICVNPRQGFALPITCDYGNHRRFSRGATPFFVFHCKQTYLHKIDPASTLGSRRVFHWVTQGFPLDDPGFCLRDPTPHRRPQ